MNSFGLTNLELSIEFYPLEELPFSVHSTTSFRIVGTKSQEVHVP